MIEVLVGPIASGKTTYARARAAQGAIIVDYDATIHALHGGDYTRYSPALKPLYKQVEMAVIMAALAMGKDVVIDKTCHCPRSRRRYIGIGHAYDVPVIAVVFANQGPETHANRRFDTDNRGYTQEHWQEVAHRHQSEMVQPTTAEGFDIVVPHQVGMQMAILTQRKGSQHGIAQA